ncbi:MAG: alpha/beta hydrolase [Pyrinomonadaceae bacterium]|nr:alpha/beta hydrolase [Sphingobacteriaceae bacterium]
MSKQQFTIAGSSGKLITIDLITRDKELKPLVIFVHGFKGFKDWGTHHLLADYFADNELNFLKFNFSHNGIGSTEGDNFDDLESFAQNSFSKELFDLGQVITFATSGDKFDKPTAIFLIGHSLGGGIGILQASVDKRIQKLVTWASISSFRNLWSPEQEKAWIANGVLHFVNSRTNQQMPIYSQLLDDLNINSQRLDILAAAKKVSSPFLMIHGEEDTSVSPLHAKEIEKQQVHKNILLIPEADHVFNARHPWNEKDLPYTLKQACQASIAFFKNSN